MNILLAESYEPAAAMLREYLAAAGHGVQHSASGPDTLTLAQTGRFDAILMSADMPGFDGPEVACRIRALPGEAAQVPIVAFTPFAVQQVADRCRASGVDAVVTEPMGIGDLVDLLAHTVRERTPA